MQTTKTKKENKKAGGQKVLAMSITLIMVMVSQVLYMSKLMKLSSLYINFTSIKLFLKKEFMVNFYLEQ